MFFGCQTNTQSIRAGSRLLFKPVPVALPSDFQDELMLAINRVPGVQDAYLTRCKLPYESEPRLVLIIGVDLMDSHQRVAQRLMDELDPIRWDEQSIDIIPFNAGKIPTAVLETGRKIA